MAPLLSFVFLLLLRPSTSAPDTELWYINCGSSTGFTDRNGITWYGDDRFVRSGESFEITQGPKKGQYLRAFPNKKKNCYTIPVGKDRKVEVWVGIYYGNYDGKGKPPTFELMFDTTDWDKVDLSRYGDQTVSYNAIYVTKTNDAKICFGRLYDDQDPIVYSILVRVLGSRMYTQVDSSYALYRIKRYAFGANQTIRYPYDIYDRLWSPIDNSSVMLTDYQVLERNGSIPVVTNSIIGDPPARIFGHAVAPIPGAENLSITTTFLFSSPIPIYLIMYFGEIFDLGSPVPKRSFHIYQENNERLTNASEPINPSYRNVLQFSKMISQATDKTTFTLVPTTDSLLPPIISGLEAFQTKGFSQRSTNSNDVEGLAILQTRFEALGNWTGDPCLPYNYNWEWVNCSTDDTPRIISLFLSGYQLQGSLPDFSTLDALKHIDLHNNSLTGSVPGFLAQLPKLLVLNLAYNNFSSIPASLVGSNILNVTGNPLLDKTKAPPPTTGNGCDGAAYVSSFLTWIVMLEIIFLL